MIYFSPCTIARSNWCTYAVDDDIPGSRITSRKEPALEEFVRHDIYGRRVACQVVILGEKIAADGLTFNRTYLALSPIQNALDLRDSQTHGASENSNTS